MTALGIVIGIGNVATATLAVTLAIPLRRRKIRRNPFYGVRFARSFESDEIWYAVNEYGARRLMFWSIPVALAGLIAPFVVTGDRVVLPILLSLAPAICYVLACFESHRYLKRL